MNLVAREIQARLSTKMVAERYGLTPNRSGFTACPFHQERTASLKLYSEPGKGYYCFGCGAGGSVIDLVMRLYGIRFTQAIVRLNADFNLGLLTARPSARDAARWRMARAEEKRQAEKRQSMELHLAAQHCRLWQTLKSAAIGSDAWCDALYHISDVDYQLEAL